MGAPTFEARRQIRFAEPKANLRLSQVFEEFEQ
jgi:hypothetical protein